MKGVYVHERTSKLNWFSNCSHYNSYVFLEDLIRKNYDRKGFNIKINKNYEKVDEIAYAVLEELKNQGKKCEITDMKEGYLTIFKVDEKKYKMMYKKDATGMDSFLLIQLIPCK